MYTLSCEIYREGEITLYTLSWRVPNFKNFLRRKPSRKFGIANTWKHSNSSCPVLHLKMQLVGRDFHVLELYYLVTKPVCAELKIFKVPFSSGQFDAGKDLVFEKKYHIIQNNIWKYSGELSHSDLSDSRYNYNSILKLKIQFSVIDCKLNISESHMSTDIQNLLNTGLFSDTMIKSAEGIEYKVHKNVLASRSAVLRAHFEHNSTECITNVIESPFESEVMQEVLFFIYSDRAPRINDIPDKLLAAADFYQIKPLKNLSEEALYNKLTVENAMDTLNLADLYSAEILKQLILDFIKDGNGTLIMKTEGWAKTTSVELIKRICEHIASADYED